MKNVYHKILTVVAIGIFGLTALFGGFNVAQAQIYTPGYACTTLNYNLSFGMTSGDVTILQQFLISQGYLATRATGYFGGATMTAVKAYQYAHDIPVSGIMDAQTRSAISNQTCGYGYNNGYNYNNNYTYTNGYNYNNSYYNYAPVVSSLSTYSGNVGTVVTVYGTGFDQYNNTVNFGSMAITGVASYNGTSLSFTVPQPSTSCNNYNNYNYTYNYSYQYQNQNCNNSYTSYQNTYQVSVITLHGTSNALTFTLSANSYCNNYNTYYNGSYQNCNNNSYQGAPTISNVNGPTSITVGNMGTWSLSLYNPNYNSNVTTSVDWGDQYSYGGYSAASQNVYIQGQQNLTFTHTYQTPGTYTIRFSVRDANGNQNSSTMTVNVQSNYYYQY